MSTETSTGSRNDYPEWLLPYEPLVPLAELVVRANAIFHDQEALRYDQNHPEISGQWAEVWHGMIQAALQENLERTWHILDFGCGTGFASLQLFQQLPPGRIASLTCYDLSPRMLDLCREKVGRVFPAARFCADPAALAGSAPFNLLATNALLHHLPDPAQTLRELLPRLAPDAVWLAGIEPSLRFYRNEECVRRHDQYHRERPRTAKHSASRLLTASYWSRKIPKLLGLTPGPKEVTARLTVQQGLFRRRPPAKLIDRLVDFHVPHSTQEAAAGRGFDIDDLKTLFADHWSLARFNSFAFMGNTPENELPPRWRTSCAQLAAQYPRDGAYFTAIWHRTA